MTDDQKTPNRTPASRQATDKLHGDFSVDLAAVEGLDPELSAFRMPEVRLAAEVLKRAIFDYILRSQNAPDAKEDAREWFLEEFEDEHPRVMSFWWCCAVVSPVPERLAGKILTYLNGVEPLRLPQTALPLKDRK